MPGETPIPEPYQLTSEQVMAKHDALLGHAHEIDRVAKIAEEAEVEGYFNEEEADESLVHDSELGNFYPIATSAEVAHEAAQHAKAIDEFMAEHGHVVRDAAERENYQRMVDSGEIPSDAELSDRHHRSEHES